LHLSAIHSISLLLTETDQLIVLGDFNLPNMDGLIDCIRESLEFETYKQFCLLKIVQAHGVPLKSIQV